MLSACGLSEQNMPALFEGSSITGRLSADVANDWGMARAPVAAGGGDNAAGGVGVGVIDDGQAFLSLGTSGVIFAATSTFRPNPARAAHAFCHALPERWHLMSVMLSCAASVDWAAALLGEKDAAGLIAKAEALGRLDGRAIFLPYLSGERTPHNDARARGVLFGLDHDSDAAVVGQAVLEGVAFGLADGLDALTETGLAINELSVIGGGAQSAWWGRILAAALQRPLTYRDDAQLGPSYGAARLARLALTKEPVAALSAPPPATHIVEPRQSDVDALQSKRPAFKQLYASLRGAFRGEV
jgi:xylulokinase